MKVFAAIAVMTMVSMPFAAADVSAPWNGRGQDLTVDTLTDEYMTHILTQRKGGKGDPADYVTIEQDGRDPGFNDDTGVINIGVDDKAIFNTQNNFRRSELVQIVESNTEGTTSFRVSVMKEEAFVNKYEWQMIFPESHAFEIRVDATADPPMIIYLNGGSYDPKWETEFVPGTWYNFAIDVSKSDSGSHMDFYVSENDDPLALELEQDTSSEYQEKYEFHIGLLTLSSDGSEPEMAAEQDILSYNGVSIETSAPTESSAPVSNGGSQESDQSETMGESSEVDEPVEAPTAEASTADGDETESPTVTPTSAPNMSTPSKCKGRA